jgi:hypothetical protein
MATNETNGVHAAPDYAEPRSREEAEERRDAIKAELARLQGQLGDRRRQDMPGYSSWRAHTVAALAAATDELRWLKAWLKRDQALAAYEATEDAEDSAALLARAVRTQIAVHDHVHALRLRLERALAANRKLWDELTAARRHIAALEGKNRLPEAPSGGGHESWRDDTKP